MDRLKPPLYFDTNIFIYTIEGHEHYLNLLEQLFNFVFENELIVVTSELTLAECLVKPIKDGNKKAIDTFTTHIRSNDVLKVKSISRKILVDSATIRAELNLKLPDAIHVATAIDQDCKTFITNDKKLSVPGGIQSVYLEDLLTNNG